jgi:hypothetical protein
MTQQETRERELKPAPYMYRDGPGDFWKGCGAEESVNLTIAGFEVDEFDEARFYKSAEAVKLSA